MLIVAVPTGGAKTSRLCIGRNDGDTGNRGKQRARFTYATF